MPAPTSFGSMTRPGIKDGERYLYFFEKGNPQITSNMIQDLVELITEEMQSDSVTADPASDAFFASTLQYIRSQKQKGVSIV
ncbi:unnamed protein product [Linum trigynum]|uniref:Uncharacterized protein n=1 Tax=Linum trigynum TaxID=586398 RepID=A0AAV2F133_9ROSI